MTIPGLPKHPSAESIAIDEKGDIVGILKKQILTKSIKTNIMLLSSI